MDTKKFYNLKTINDQLWLINEGGTNVGGHSLSVVTEDVSHDDRAKFLFFRANSDDSNPKYMICNKSSGSSAFCHSTQISCGFGDYKDYDDDPETYLAGLENHSGDSFRVKFTQQGKYWYVNLNDNSVDIDTAFSTLKATPADGEIALPSIEESGDITILPPELDNPTIPPQVDGWHGSKITWLPYVLVDDNSFEDGSIDDPRINKSTYYSLERRVYWFTEGKWLLNNGTSTSQKREEVTIFGWEETESETFTHATGIELGLNFDIPFGDISVNVSYDFSYSSTESFTQFGSVEDHIIIKAPPHTTVIAWQTSSEFILRDASGREVKRWRKKDDSIHYDEYKHEGEKFVLSKRYSANGRQAMKDALDL